MYYFQHKFTRLTAILAICIAGSFELGQLGFDKAVELEHLYYERYCYKPTPPTPPIPQIDKVVLNFWGIIITQNYLYGCFAMLGLTLITTVIYLDLRSS